MDGRLVSEQGDKDPTGDRHGVDKIDGIVGALTGGEFPVNFAVMFESIGDSSEVVNTPKHDSLHPLRETTGAMPFFFDFLLK